MHCWLSPGRVLSYHADSSRYIILTSLLNHYAWVHVQYTPALGGKHTHTPEPNHPTHASTQTPSTASAVLLVSCSYSTQSYISTRRSVDHNPGSEHTETAPLLETGFWSRKRLRIAKNEQQTIKLPFHAYRCWILQIPPIPGISAIYISRTLKSKTVQKQWNLISPPKKVFHQISLHLNNFLVCAENNILLGKIFSIQRQHSIRKTNSGIYAPLWVALARRMQVYQNPSWGTLKCVKIWSV